MDVFRRDANDPHRETVTWVPFARRLVRLGPITGESDVQRRADGSVTASGHAPGGHHAGRAPKKGENKKQEKKNLFSRYFGGGVRASQARSSFADAEVKGPCLSSPISLSSRRQSLPPLRFVGFPEARASIRPTNRPNPLGFGVGSPKISRVLASDFFPFQSILISVVNSVGFIVLTSGLVLYFYCRGARSSGVLSILLSNFRG